jgi:hypothetical protein
MLIDGRCIIGQDARREGKCCAELHSTSITASSSAMSETKSHLPQTSNEHTESTSQSGPLCMCDDIVVWQLGMTAEGGKAEDYRRFQVAETGAQ